MKLPHTKKPCTDCPFKKDTLKGWLGKRRMTEILNSDSFVCHKKTTLQCAGHMLLNEDNSFVALAKRMNIKLNISGKDQLFSNKQECIDHHTEYREIKVLN